MFRLCDHRRFVFAGLDENMHNILSLEGNIVIVMMSNLLHPLIVRNKLFDPVNTPNIAINYKAIVSGIISAVVLLGIMFYIKYKYKEQVANQERLAKLLSKYTPAFPPVYQNTIY